ncbi:MAG: efflux RND transporter periplasmic adaptor subunit [Bacteroidetes bacterium]|nr:efflux RND transporter periplasmic adaptor subunit [Bacteroidota bacterium]
MKKIGSYGFILLLASTGLLTLPGCVGGSGEHSGKDTGMQGMSGMDMPSTTAAKGHKVTDIALDQLLRPTDRFVLSSIPVTTMRSDTVQPQLAVLGTISYDTRLTNTISARVSGRIERLYIRYRYQHVHKGDRILDIYSPELQTGEQEYLYLLKNDPGNTVLINAARQRLLLLGVGGRQLDEVARTGKALPVLTVYSAYTGHIHDAGTMPVGDRGMGATEATTALPIKEGMYVEKGQPVFQVFNMDHSWAVLNLFPGQEGLVRRGDPVEIVPETAPDKAFNGRIDLVEPFYRQGLRSATVRVYFDNGMRELPIGSAVKATIRPAPQKGSWLSRDAVLSLGTRQVVFLRTDGGFRAHAVTTGMTEGQRVRILSGLSAGDSVAANAQFLVDSEDFIKAND